MGVLDQMRDETQRFWAAHIEKLRIMLAEPSRRMRESSRQALGLLRSPELRYLQPMTGSYEELWGAYSSTPEEGLTRSESEAPSGSG